VDNDAMTSVAHPASSMIATEAVVRQILLKQEALTNCDRLVKLKFSPSLPYAFTEHGALMLGNVLKTRLRKEESKLAAKCSQLEMPICADKTESRLVISLFQTGTTYLKRKGLES
jgi:hypothetical protein